MEEEKGFYNSNKKLEISEKAKDVAEKLTEKYGKINIRSRCDSKSNELYRFIFVKFNNNYLTVVLVDKNFKRVELIQTPDTEYEIRLIGSDSYYTTNKFDGSTILHTPSEDFKLVSRDDLSSTRTGILFYVDEVSNYYITWSKKVIYGLETDLIEQIGNWAILSTYDNLGSLYTIYYKACQIISARGHNETEIVKHIFKFEHDNMLCVYDYSGIKYISLEDIKKKRENCPEDQLNKALKDYHEQIGEQVDRPWRLDL